MWRYSRALSFPLVSFDQELQQQLIIETRDLKKTRNFYQKLIHQERRSKGRVTGRRRRRTAGSIKLCMCLKGPESKSMLFKLKSQLEELRSRVAFLERVKEYLQVRRKLLVSPSALPLPKLQMSPCVSEDPERGAVGFGPLGAAFAGCLRTRLFGSSVLRGPLGALLRCRPRKGLPAERIASGPDGLSLRKVPSAMQKPLATLRMMVLLRSTTKFCFQTPKH